MIQQQVGDLLEVQFDGAYWYVVVLTKIVMFGGNIVFAYHTDGTKQDFARMLLLDQGFNVCTDLLWPKKHGIVTRLHRFDDITRLWKTQYVKGTNEYRPGHKSRE